MMNLNVHCMSNNLPLNLEALVAQASSSESVVSITIE